jgi:hypothetical protein
MPLRLPKKLPKIILILFLFVFIIQMVTILWMILRPSDASAADLCICNGSAIRSFNVNAAERKPSTGAARQSTTNNEITIKLI